MKINEEYHIRMRALGIALSEADGTFDQNHPDKCVIPVANRVMGRSNTQHPSTRMEYFGISQNEHTYIFCTIPLINGLFVEVQLRKRNLQDAVRRISEVLDREFK